MKKVYFLEKLVHCVETCCVKSDQHKSNIFVLELKQVIIEKVDIKIKNVSGKRNSDNFKNSSNNKPATDHLIKST